jgi:cyclophilin family peptidyl-prolyl cis-trans isomerase
MTSTPPLAGSHTPDTLELLWERNRKLIQAAFWLLVAGLIGYYGLQYYERGQKNAQWSDFASSVLLTDTYSPQKTDGELASAESALSSLLTDLKETPTTELEAALARADAAQAPFLLWLLANKAARAGDAEAAAKARDSLRSRFPNHPLCAESDYPVQVRDPIPEDKDKKDKSDKDKQAKPDKEPELQPAKAGSPIGIVVDQLQAAKAFSEPSQFRKPEIPPDAPRYRIAFEGDYGELVVALMPTAAPLHCAKFDSLVTSNFWNGIKVDEIIRPGSSRWGEQVREFHFGFESTRTEASRTDWDTTTASVADHVVEEVSPLSHFAGALAARSRDGKSEVDRLHLCETDSPSRDERRQVFGYVVEGIETLRRICDVDFARSEDQALGRGAPAENIVIKSITKL